jgi:iseA protein
MENMKKMIILIMAAFALFSFCTGVTASSTKDLTSSQAKELVLSARQHYWDVMNGHILNEKNSKCSSEFFKYKNTEYRYFCSELDTKKELVNYLNEVFTLNAISKGIKKYKFIEYKGKMAQPNADGGSLLEWEKAKGKLIYQRKDIRLFQYSVPYGDPVQYAKQKVTFVKVKGKWQINAIDAVK